MPAGVLLTTVSGRQMDLATPGNWNRAIAYGGISGLVGSLEASTATAVGVPGQTPTSFQVKPMTGELTLHVVDSDDGEVVDDLVAELRREIVGDEYCTMIIDRGGAAGSKSGQVRLNGFIDPPQAFGDDYAEVRIPLISDEGLWTQRPLYGSGNVTVTNVGQVFLWVEIEWSEESTVVLPSGLTYTLPASPDGAVRRLSTNPWTSHEVYRVDDTVDEELSELTKMMHLGEGVPKKASRTYETAGDARVSWAPQYLDPWR